MRAKLILLCATLSFLSLAQPSQAEDCAYDPKTTGLSRIVAVDSTAGPVYGKVHYNNDVKAFTRSIALREKEVILTFDDGPLPPTTNIILDTLDKYCVKATFFAVGRMAMSNARTLKEIDRRGHTLGTHTYSHPRAMDTMAIADIQYEVEKGFAAVSHALGKPIAPFFRFPGLRDSAHGVSYLASRNISTWSVDVISGDTEPTVSAEKIAHDTLARIRRLGRGIVLLHDIKRPTADALETILYTLRAEGYKVVHAVSNTSYQPDPEVLANAELLSPKARPVSFTGQFIASARQQLKDGNVEYMHTEWIDLQKANNRSLLQRRVEEERQPASQTKQDWATGALPASVRVGGEHQSIR